MIPSQIYLRGRLADNPEIATTKKGKPWVRILIETSLVRETWPTEYQSERIVLPLQCFGGEAEVAKNLRAGTELTVGCHLYGSTFTTSIGRPKHGVMLIVDRILESDTRPAQRTAGAMTRPSPREEVR
jgi:single-stranded DNA-binding protein